MTFLRTALFAVLLASCLAAQTIKMDQKADYLLAEILDPEITATGLPGLLGMKLYLELLEFKLELGGNACNMNTKLMLSAERLADKSGNHDGTLSIDEWHCFVEQNENRVGFLALLKSRNECDSQSARKAITK